MDHSNTATGTRVELHCHTKLGSVGAVNSAAEIIKAAIEEAMSAVAITDVGVAYAFRRQRRPANRCGAQQPRSAGQPE